MRFVTFLASGDRTSERVGVLGPGGAVHELPGVGRLVDLLGEGEGELRSAGARALADELRALALADVTLMAPVPVPPSVRDFLTFEQHQIGTLLNQGDVRPPNVFYRQPIFYFSNPAATIGPGDPVPLPPGTRSFDFELEVAAVVGREGANLSVDEARDHIAGYTILIDWSARDIQFREMLGTLGPAKGKDTATTLGPWLVTADELAPFASGPSFALEMEVELNGEPFGRDRLDNMGWSFAQMVAYASRGTRIVPGDILGSGTCANGCLAEEWGRQGPDRRRRVLAAGDVLTFRVEGLGEITQRVAEGLPLVDIGGFWHHDDP